MSTPVPRSWVADLFRRFRVMFGAQRMAAQYPDLDEAIALWADELGRYDARAVGAAVEALAKLDRAWPPTIGEFVALVQAQAERPSLKAPSLPVPRRTPEEVAAGRERLDAMLASLGRRLRPPAANVPRSRVPGEDDEQAPSAQAPACRCWVGRMRSTTPCEACAAFARGPVAVRAVLQGSDPT